MGGRALEQMESMSEGQEVRDGLYVVNTEPHNGKDTWLEMKMEMRTLFCRQSGGERHNQKSLRKITLCTI